MFLLKLVNEPLNNSFKIQHPLRFPGTMGGLLRMLPRNAISFATLQNHILMGDPNRDKYQNIDIIRYSVL